VWCTKHYDDSERSFLRIEAAREVPPPSTDVLVATTTASASTVAYKEQIYAAVAGAAELPTGPGVRLELSFVVGPSRNWLNLEADNRLTGPTPRTYLPSSRVASTRRQDHRARHARHR
jgi:hypothetical protein